MNSKLILQNNRRFSDEKILLFVMPGFAVKCFVNNLKQVVYSEKCCK